MDQSISLLLDIDGLVVDRVVRDGTGGRVVHCSTDPELAGWCPDCGQQSTAPKARVITRPRDVVIVACQRDGTTVLPRAWDHLGAALSMAVIDWPGQRRHAGPAVGVAGRTVLR